MVTPFSKHFTRSPPPPPKKKKGEKKRVIFIGGRKTTGVRICSTLSVLCLDGRLDAFGHVFLLLTLPTELSFRKQFWFEADFLFEQCLVLGVQLCEGNQAWIGAGQNMEAVSESQNISVTVVGILPCHGKIVTFSVFQDLAQNWIQLLLFFNLKAWFIFV